MMQLLTMVGSSFARRISLSGDWPAATAHAVWSRLALVTVAVDGDVPLVPLVHVELAGLVDGQVHVAVAPYEPVVAEDVVLAAVSVGSKPLAPLALAELLALVGAPVLVDVVLNEPVVADDVLLAGVAVVVDVPLVPQVLDELAGLVDVLVHVAMQLYEPVEAKTPCSRRGRRPRGAAGPVSTRRAARAGGCAGTRGRSAARVCGGR